MVDHRSPETQRSTPALSDLRRVFTRDGGERVTNVELFFDLVYVFAVTQLSHLLLGELNARGAFHTLLLMLAVWWAWIYTAWITNWFDPDNRVVRAMLLCCMLVSLVMAAVLPGAFGDRGLAFAACFVTLQVGRSLFAVAALGGDPPLRRNFQRILAWSGAAGALRLIGGLASGTGREVAWLLVIAAIALAIVIAVAAWDARLTHAPMIAASASLSPHME